MKILEDQKIFFDKIALNHNKICLENYTLFEFYSFKIVSDALTFLSDCNSVIDYGCGLGENIEMYHHGNGRYPLFLHGVDISENCLEVCYRNFKNYNYKFSLIVDNLDFLNNQSFDGGYIVNVLHHTDDHNNLLLELLKKIKKGGKLVVIDSGSDSVLHNLLLKIFPYVPKFIKKNYSNDLIIDGNIPNKIPVHVNSLCDLLKSNNHDYELIFFNGIISSLCEIIKGMGIKISQKNLFFKKLLNLDFFLANYLHKNKSNLFVLKINVN